MNITITNEITGEILGPFELSGDMKLIDLMALVECKEGREALWHNTKRLEITDKGKTLEQLGIKDNDLLLLRQEALDSTNTKAPGAASIVDDNYIERMRLSLLNNPSLRSTIAVPGLEQLLQNSQLFKQIIGPLILNRYSQVGTQNPFGIPQLEYNSLMSNPDISENQRKISELINQQEIDEQMRNAMEYTPEVFTSVHMLYISLEINNHPVKAFVDSGAQTTIISTALAEKTQLTRLIDRRFRGIAMGVGKSEIVGRIHAAQIKIETRFIPCSFAVLDTNVDMLLGLDMLKRYQASIDLKDNVLRIAGVETRFLSEHELPKELEDSVTSLDPTGMQVENTEHGAEASMLPPSSFEEAAATSKQDLAQKYPESVVKRLMDLGFSRAEVMTALEQSGGNPEYAAAILFQ